MKSRFCYFIHAGLLVPESKELKKKTFFISFFHLWKLFKQPFLFFFYQILDMGIILCENIYVDKEINA